MNGIKLFWSSLSYGSRLLVWTQQRVWINKLFKILIDYKRKYPERGDIGYLTFTLNLISYKLTSYFYKY